MREALNASPCAASRQYRLSGGAEMRNPRFLDAGCHTGLIAQDYPNGFHPSHAGPSAPAAGLRAWPPYAAGAT